MYVRETEKNGVGKSRLVVSAYPRVKRGANRRVESCEVIVNIIDETLAIPFSPYADMEDIE